MTTSSDWFGTAPLLTAPAPGQPNTIQIIATDDAGNTTDVPATLIINAITPGSTTVNPPVLSITQPAESPITIVGDDGLVYAVEGTATSDVGIGSVTVSGQPASLDSTGFFSVLVILSTGENTITVVATDTQATPLSTTIVSVINLAPGAPSPVTVDVSPDQVRMGVAIHERGFE